MLKALLGFRLAKDLNPDKYEVSLISPRNHFVFTPLLASTSVGTLEFRNICETIRHHNPNVNFVEGTCEDIDFANRKLKVATSFTTSPDLHSFEMGYDKLIVAVGARVNTFGIKGVQENAYFLKEIKDAQKIRRRVMDCFEKASLPGASEETKKRVLNFAVVGGGPTGVEFSAELHDFVKEDLSRIYPNLMPYVRMTLYDVAPKILTAFDSRLTEYATKLFSREGIRIQTRTSVLELKRDSMILNTGKEIPVGLVVWATGVTETPLIASLGEKVRKQNKRLVTDDRLRLLSAASGQVIDENVYGLGDCASIRDNAIACTAQAAEQQARYLVKVLNKGMSENTPPFQFHNRGVMAYLGNWNAIVELKDPTPSNSSLTLSGKPATIKQAGRVAWFLWRSAYMSKSVSWRNRIFIPFYWFMTYVFGRDVSRF
ncbi:hypothetical protein DSO57_1011434 [Entomophthora muscae]|uniref:Uncharacterized protein n=1 Tax=Entomophthora muscae TaxID=34485 RepID=A0ACC2USM1_9FUNG|nr:hypothetical protein DSO57_1011434 [Entomophthora muscae]